MPTLAMNGSGIPTLVITPTNTPPAHQIYELVVENGIGDGEYHAGTNVSIAEKCVHPNYFSHWVVLYGNTFVDNATSGTTTLVMSADLVVIVKAVCEIGTHHPSSSVSPSSAPQSIAPTYNLTSVPTGVDFNQT